MRPLVKLMIRRAREGHAAFDSEQQNDPVAGDDAPFAHSIRFWVNRLAEWVFYGACDPSLGKAGASRDPSAILVGGLDRRTGVLDVVEAPIRLRCDPGVRAVGAWLGASARDPFDTSLIDGQPLFGALWLALAADPAQWHLVTADGWTGDVCRVGTALTAPFVAARATGADRIVEARFDVSRLGTRRYDKLAVSELTLEL